MRRSLLLPSSRALSLATRSRFAQVSIVDDDAAVYVAPKKARESAIEEGMTCISVFMAGKMAGNIDRVALDATAYIAQSRFSGHDVTLQKLL